MGVVVGTSHLYWAAMATPPCKGWLCGLGESRQLGSRRDAPLFSSTQNRRHYIMALKRGAYHKRGPSFTDMATLIRSAN